MKIATLVAEVYNTDDKLSSALSVFPHGPAPHQLVIQVAAQLLAHVVSTTPPEYYDAAVALALAAFTEHCANPGDIALNSPIAFTDIQSEDIKVGV